MERNRGAGQDRPMVGGMTTGQLAYMIAASHTQGVKREYLKSESDPENCAIDTLEKFETFQRTKHAFWNSLKAENAAFFRRQGEKR